RAGSGAPREPDASVDHENATMIAIVDLADRRHLHGVEAGHLAPGLGQTVSKLGGHAQRSDPIHEHVAADARPTTLTNGLDGVAPKPTAIGSHACPHLDGVRCMSLLTVTSDAG